MATPITWRNINSPNVAGVNALLSRSSEQLGGALGNIGDRFIAQGEYNKKENTEDILGQLGQLGSYDEVAAARANLLNQGGNVDEGVLSNAFDKRQGVLGQRELFESGRQAEQVGTDVLSSINQGIQEGSINTLAEGLQLMNRRASAAGLTPQQTLTLDNQLRAFNAPTPEQDAITARAALLEQRKYDEGVDAQKQKNEIAIQKLKNQGKNTKAYSNLRDNVFKDPFIKNIENEDPTDAYMLKLSSFISDIADKGGKINGVNVTADDIIQATKETFGGDKRNWFTWLGDPNVPLESGFINTGVKENLQNILDRKNLSTVSDEDTSDNAEARAANARRLSQ